MPSEEWRARLGLSTVLLVGTTLLALHISHALAGTETAWSLLVGILLPALFALVVAVGGGWLWGRNVGGDYLLRVGAWCLIGALVLAGGAWLTVLHQQAEGVAMTGRPFVVVNAASRGAVVGFVVGVYDGRRQTARVEADRLSRQLTVLNRVLRHDIRNEAMVIKGNVDLLADEVDDANGRTRRIRRQASELVELGRQARDIERMLQEGTERQAVDLAPIADRCVERARAEHPDAEFECSVADAPPVSAHPLVGSALGNVVENAAEHNDTETPHVTVDATTVRDGGTEHVEVRVADDGPGIPETETAVLERGYETDLDHTSGLGLWLVHWIVTESGGSVRYEDNDPEGSVVVLRFERAPPGAVSADAPSVGVDDPASGAA